MPNPPKQAEILPTAALPETIELLIIGRPEGGALDPATGQRAYGGVAYQDGLETVRLAPGDIADVPYRAAGAFLADGLAVDPNAPADEPDDEEIA